MRIRLSVTLVGDDPHPDPASARYRIYAFRLQRVAGICQASLDVFCRKVIVFVQDLLDRPSARKQIDDELDGNPGSPDDRFCRPAPAGSTVMRSSQAMERSSFTHCVGTYAMTSTAYTVVVLRPQVGRTGGAHPPLRFGMKCTAVAVGDGAFGMLAAGDDGAVERDERLRALGDAGGLHDGDQRRLGRRFDRQLSRLSPPAGIPPATPPR